MASSPARTGNTPDAPSVRLKYAPQGPVMRDFHTSKCFVRMVIGPLGSSKTYGAINELMRCIHNQVPNRDGVRKSRWCVARNSFPDLNSATIPDFRTVSDAISEDFTMGAPPTWKVKYKRLDGTMVEASVLFRSFDGPQDVKKARGMQLTGVLVDEIGEFNKSNFDMLIGRVKRYPSRAEVSDANFSVLAIGNAVPKDHWLYELVQHTPENWFLGVQPGGVIKKGGQWVENPRAENIQNLAKHYYKDQLAGKKDSWIRQNLANEFVHHVDGRPIHPDFSETLHVQPVEAIPGLPLHLGQDWGRTPACVIAQQLPNGRWIVVKEICLINAGADKLGKHVRSVLNTEFSGFEIYQSTGDPAGTQMAQTQDETPFDLFAANADIESMPASTNDPEIRFAALDDLLTTIIEGQPAIVVDPGCQVLVAGLAGKYCFKRVQVTGDEKYKDQPDKTPESHVCEALHYMLLGGGQGETLFDDAHSAVYDDVPSWAPDTSFFE